MRGEPQLPGMEYEYPDPEPTLSPQQMKSQAIHKRFAVMRERMETEDFGPSDYFGKTGSDDGLVEGGTTRTRGIIPRGDAPPGWAGFHSLPQSAWKRHGRVEWIDPRTITTHQDVVSTNRVREAKVNDDLSKDAYAIRGLEPDLPRVYRNNPLPPEAFVPGTRVPHQETTLHLVDGNHRIAADILNGRLFSQVRTISVDDYKPMAKAAMKFNDQRRKAYKKTVDRGTAQAVHDRSVAQFLGKANP